MGYTLPNSLSSKITLQTESAVCVNKFLSSWGILTIQVFLFHSDKKVLRIALKLFLLSEGCSRCHWRSCGRMWEMYEVFLVVVNNREVEIERHKKISPTSRRFASSICSCFRLSISCNISASITFLASSTRRKTSASISSRRRSSSSATRWATSSSIRLLAASSMDLASDSFWRLELEEIK